ncbi:hypothetical protein NC652_013801 [Populus alba x Populus x berolinensis]|nr:hypothetical protein NC652_013801 [Populus alba x Populus x berolinensis]
MNDELEIEKHMQSNGNRATACQTDGLLVFFGSEASLNLKMRENEFKSEEGEKELHLTNKENVEGNIESCLKRSGQDDAEIMGEENEMHVQNDKHVDTAGALESSPNLKKCACAIEPDPDSNGKDYDGGVEKVMAKMLQSSWG